MSIDVENTGSQLTELDLLQAILVQLKLLVAMHREVYELELEEDDIDG